jgi:glycosyltransferase involved in cell wall biosynthesis
MTAGHRVGPVDHGSGPVGVVTVLWRLSPTGGVPAVVRTLADHVDPQRVALSVVSARPAWEHDGVSAVPVPVVGLGHEGSAMRPWTRARLAWAARRMVKASRASVVHLHSGTVWLGALAGGWGRRRRVLVEVHDAPGSGRHGRSTDLVEGWYVRGSRALVVCHSEAVADAVGQRWRVPADRVRTFALSVDTARFRPRTPEEIRTARQRHEVPEDAFAVGVTGRLVASKRVVEAARAVGTLAGTGSAVLVLVGDGPERERALAAAHEAGLAGVATGVLAPEEMAEVVAALDVVVSASEYEGFGLTMAEAMACGVPVVATAVGGVADVVDNGVTGLLVALGDDASLAGAIGRLRDDGARRLEMGRAGAVRARSHFGPDRLANAFTECYRELALRR